MVSRAISLGWPLIGGQPVGQVIPPVVTLGALSISPNTATVGTAYTGTISGATAGSTITISGLTVSGSGTTRSVSGTPSAAGTPDLVETLAGAVNSPRTTSGQLTVSAAAQTLNALGLSPSTATVGQPYSGTITGKTAGSTVALSPSIAGLSVSGTSVSGTPSATGTPDLVETLAGATNSPRTTSGLLTIASGAVAGSAATNFATAPDTQFHPNSQSATTDSSSGVARVTACPDLRGLAALTALAASGPVQMTDALGRKFWRFNGTTDGETGSAGVYATIANALNNLSNRGFTVMMVGRVPHGRSTVNFLNPRYQSDGVTAANASIGLMRATVTSSSAPYLQAGSPAASTNTTDCYKVIPGAQLQVLGVASRTTANGGTRLYVNNDKCDVAQQGTLASGYQGAVLGGTAAASDAVTTSVNNVFDLYELAIWRGELTNTQADALMAAAVTNYGIAQLDQQLVLEGDSITDGIRTALAVSPAWHGSMSTLMTEPGTSFVPASCRVVSLGTSGSQTSGLVSRRDAVASIFDIGKYPGGAAKNAVAVQIGRNDAGVGAKTAQQLYDDVVATINTASTGYLQRGWRVYQAANIAGSTGVQAVYEAVRVKYADTTNHVPLPQFLTDTLSGSGQTYAGLVNVLHLYDITVGGQTAFKVTADALRTADGYYNSDNTHLRVAGIQLMLSGGDTPQYGYRSIFP